MVFFYFIYDTSDYKSKFSELFSADSIKIDVKVSKAQFLWIRKYLVSATADAGNQYCLHLEI